MKAIKLFLRSAALILALSLFICGQPWTKAAAETIQNASLSEKYLSEVKLFVSKSVDGAKADAKAQGYEVYEKNLNDDGDKFSTVVLLGYKTTQDKDDAITDLSVLDMKLSGFTIVDIGKEEDKLLPQFSEQARYYLQQALAFRDYTKEKTVGSYYAKEMLNYFYIEQNGKKVPFGEYVLSSDCDIVFFERMLAKMNAKFIPVISTALTIGSSDPETELWVDRMNKSDIDARVKKAANGWTAKDGTETKPEELMWIDLAYSDKAYMLYQQLQNFAAVYNESVQVRDTKGLKGVTREDLDALSEKTEAEAEKALENVTSDQAASAVELDVYERFNAFTTKSGEKLGDFLIRMGSMTVDREGNLRDLYSMVDGLTNAQLASVKTTGVEGLLKTLTVTGFDEKYFSKLRTECLKKLSELGLKDGINVWADCVDSSKIIAQTTEFIRQNKAGKLNSEYEESLVTHFTKWDRAMAIIEITSMIYSGIWMVTDGIVKLATGATFTAMVWGWTTTLWAIGGILGTVGSIVCGMFLFAYFAFMAFGLIMLLVMVCELLVEKGTNYPEYKYIPDTVYDVKTVNSKKYAVRYETCSSYQSDKTIEQRYEDEDVYIQYESHNGHTVPVKHHYTPTLEAFAKKVRENRAADVNGYCSECWVNLYYTKTRVGGNPIKVDSSGVLFKSSSESSLAPAGYRPVSRMGLKSAENLNNGARAGDGAKDFFLFVTGDPADVNTGETQKGNGTYIQDIKIAYAQSKTGAISALEKDQAGYKVIEENLAETGYAYLGYTLTNNPDMALRDIRVSSTDLTNAAYGGGTYGCAGIIPSSRLAVWTTRYESLGSPIQSIRILNSRSAPKGWEPANTFSGGSACNLSTEYFAGINKAAPNEKTSITMPSKGKFLYFLPSVTYTGGTRYVAGVSYFATCRNAGSNENKVEDRGFKYLTSESKAMAEYFGFDIIASRLCPNQVFLKYIKDEWVSGADSTKSTPYMLPFDMMVCVSYTYNPTRAITGITTFQTASNGKLEDAITTPAGNLILSPTIYNGMPRTQSIHSNTFDNSDYGNDYPQRLTYDSLYKASDKGGATVQPLNSDWQEVSGKSKYIVPTTKGIYLLGPDSAKLPIKDSDLKFTTSTIDDPEWVPVHDLYFPESSNPTNLAFENSVGNKRLYLYINAYAGGKAGEKTESSTEEKRDSTMIYRKKQYISGVYVGVGDTHAKAIADVYSKMAAASSGTSKLLSELDEVVFYSLRTKIGNTWYRRSSAKEEGEKYAYIGVTRTDSRSEALYGLLKYYSSSDNNPEELTVEDANSKTSVKLSSCGEAIDAPDGKFAVYACRNSAAAQYLSPITHIVIDQDIYKPSTTEARTLTDSEGVTTTEKRYFGYNPVVTATKSQLNTNYLELKPRPNETSYIHLGYDVSDQPYIEAMYIATGKNKKEAYSNLLKRTSAYIASGVDLNYNAEANEWIAFGYRRHSKSENCITDTMVYIGSDPPREFSVDRAAAKGGGTVKVRYFRASDISLNEGTNGDPMYLYYTRQHDFAGASPLTDICFAYNDRTPDDVDPVTGKPANWEYVLSSRDYNAYPNGDLRRCDFNTYVVPKVGKWHMSDHRIYMFVRHENGSVKSGAAVRQNPNTIYKYGNIKQKKR